MHRLFRILRSHNGSATVDFAFVAVPLLMVTLSIVETATIVLTQEVLLVRITDAGRMITNGGLIGQSSTAGIERIKSAVCDDGVFILAPAVCRAALHVDVRKVDGSPIPASFSNGLVSESGFTYQETSGGDLVLLRLAIIIPRISPFNLPIWKRLSDGSYAVGRAGLFKQNPYAAYNVVGPTS